MSVEELVNEKYAQLSESDRAVWKYISSHRQECQNLSIEVMAKRCCVSRSAVMRFAQKLGFHGFAELKVFLKIDGQASDVSDQYMQVRAGYDSVIENVEKKDCSDIFAAMDAARRLYICGEGMVQSSIKKEFKRIFMSAGCMIYDVPAGQELFNLLPIMSGEDFCILISVSGENEKMVQAARHLRVRGTQMLSITKNRDNTLAHLCDYHLYVEQSAYIRTPTQWLYESTTSYFILIDVLFLKYLEYRKRKEQDHAAGDTCTAEI